MTSRVAFLQQGATAGALALLSACIRGGTTASPSTASAPTRMIEFVTEEITRSNVDVSPDGLTIIFDALCDIYTVPISGGDATPVLTGGACEVNPRFSPDGTRIAFLSDRSGAPEVWTVKPDGAEPAPYGAALDQRGVIPDSVQTPGWMPSSRYRRPGSGEPPGFNVKTSPDGRLLAFAKYANGRNVLMIRALTGGQERVLVDSVASMAVSQGYSTYMMQTGIPEYAFTPDSRSIVLSNFGKLTRVDVVTGVRERIPLRVRIRQQIAEPITPRYRVAESDDVRARILRWPTLTPDGRRLVFSALGKLYATDTNRGMTRRLTASAEFEFAPAVSPDGRWIAYVTWSDSALGAVMIMPATGGAPRRLTPEPGRYANPAWSRDGRKLAFLRDTTSRGDPRGTDKFVVLWVPAFDRAAVPRQAAITERYRGSLGLRYYPSVAFNGDGNRLFYTELTREPSSARVVMDQRLVSVQLDGSDRREHLRFPAVDEIVPSPDGRHVALLRLEHIMLAPLPARPDRPVDLYFDGDSASVMSLAREGGTHIAWQDSATVTWASTSRIYRRRLGAPQPELVVDVDLRVPRARPVGIVAFTNARLITMRGDELVQQGTIVVERDRIVAVGLAGRVRIPRDAHVIDVSGATIIPGLGDVHTHIHLTDREIFPERRREYIANLAYGVTTTYDPAAPTLDTFGQAEMVEAGAILGPRIYSSGDPIFAEEPGRRDYLPIRNLDHAREIVRRYAKYQPALLKQYGQPRRDHRQWLAQAAAEAGVRITAEGRDVVLNLTILSDGYTSFEHGMWSRPLREDVIQFIARSGVHWTPTITVAVGGTDLGEYYGRREWPEEEDPKLLRFTPAHLVERYRRRKRDTTPERFLAWLDDARAASRIVRAGGVVSTGSHSALNGLATHWEMWGLAAGGLTNHEALRAATLAPTQKLGFERDLGSLEPGKLADFVVLERNPLEDIRNSVAIRYVVANGFIYDAETMTRIWPTGTAPP